MERKRRKLSETVKVKYEHCEPLNPFNSLPDELLLKIVKMSSKKKEKKSCESSLMGKCEISESGMLCQYDHNFIVEVISNVSLRFNGIAQDQELWRNCGSKLLYIRHGPNSFNSLPDKVLLKIVKMLSKKKGKKTCDSDLMGKCEISESGVLCQYNHNFIVEVISKVSLRFSGIAQDKELWKNCGAKMLYIRQGPNSFNSLPNKVFTKILRMVAVTDMFLDYETISQLGKVSRRFRNAVTHDDFGDGCRLGGDVLFNEKVPDTISAGQSKVSKQSQSSFYLLFKNQQILEDVIQNYLPKSTPRLYLSRKNDIYGSPESLRDTLYPFSGGNICALAKKCPNMEKLDIRYGCIVWPRLRPIDLYAGFKPMPPWNLLWSLSIIGEIHPIHTFECVALHHTCPNLKSLRIGAIASSPRPILLPELKDCKKLSVVCLSSPNKPVKFLFQRNGVVCDVEKYIPLPSSVEKLDMVNASFALSSAKQSFEDHKTVLKMLEMHLGDEVTLNC